MDRKKHVFHTILVFIFLKKKFFLSVHFSVVFIGGFEPMAPSATNLGLRPAQLREFDGG